MSMPANEAPRSAVATLPAGYWKRAVAGVSLALLAGVLVLYFTADDAGWERLKEFPRALIPVILAMVGTAWVCNGLRTWMLARALGHRLTVRRSVGITLSMEFAIAATPGGVGGMATRLALQRQAGIPLPHTMTMIAGDASADILYFLLLAPIAVSHTIELSSVRSLWSGIPWLSIAPWIIGGAVTVALLGWILVRLGMVRLVRALPHSWRRRGRLDARWRGMRRAGRQHLRDVASAARYLAKERRSHYLASFLLACVQWTCRYGVLPVILWGLGALVDPLALFFVQGALFIVGLLIVAPGGGGSLEILSTLILRPLVGGGTAALAVVLWRIFTYYLYLAGGACAFAAMVWKGSSRKRQSPAEPGPPPASKEGYEASRLDAASDSPRA